MAEYIPFDTLAEADTRSAEWWAVVRGAGWQPGNVTQYLYGRVEVDGVPCIEVTARDTDLDTLIIDDDLEPQEAGACSDLYPAWAVGTTYAIDDLVGYADSLWKCRQAHTVSDPGWIPPNVPALWLVYRKNADQLLDWVAGEPVSVGTRRTYDGDEYECIQAHVTQSDWTPPAVPALWALVAPPTADWAVGVAYSVGDHVMYLGNEYICLQQHTSIQTWNPVATLNVLWWLA